MLYVVVVKRFIEPSDPELGTRTDYFGPYDIFEAQETTIEFSCVDNEDLHSAAYYPLEK